MVRKLAMAVSLALGTLPLSVYALGLGDIETSSALNEKFNAEIELLSVKKGELDSLKVGLAPYKVFERNGVERPYVLSTLHFKPVRTRDGRTVIRVTSDQPIREPYLDFFVQLAWPKGQLVREYTVLLDPPVLTKRQAPAVAVAGSVPARPVHRKTRRPVVEPGGEYGPVRANETLWQIAERVRPAGITVHQMMMALYRANPHAFLHGNINLLKKGRTLKVPPLEEIQALDRRQAVAEFARATRTGNAVPAARSSGKGSAAPAEPAASAGRLEIAGAEKATSAPGGASDAEALRRKLMVVEEQAESARQEAANLRSRMDEMEAQLAEMKRLLALKNATLAQLQQAGTGGAVAAAAPAVQPPPAEPTQLEPLPELGREEAATAAPEAQAPEAAASQAMPATPETAGIEPVSQPATAGGPTEAPATAEIGGSAFGVEPEPAAPAPAEKVETAQQPPQAPEPEGTHAPVPAKPVPRPAEQGWQQWLSDNWPLAAGGGGVVLLGLLGLALARRRREPESGADMSLAPAPQATPVQPREPESILRDDQAGVAPAGPDSAMSDTSFLSEYSTEELRSLNEDTMEADPVSEADVYIAYGRYSQAEEILQEAMHNGNQSAAVRHKMLEVYYATQKKDEFRKLAEQMKEDGQDREDPQAWDHILAMGRDLDRHNPLFAAAATAGTAAAAGAAAASSINEDSDLALDLSSLAEEVDSSLNPESEMAEEFSTLDLELPSLQITPQKGEESSTSSLMQEEGGDLDELQAEAPTELQTDLADLEDLGDLGIESNFLDESLDNVASDLENAVSDSRILDEPLELDQEISSTLDEIQSSLTTEELTRGGEPPSSGDEDSRLGDEVETKLELARAFLDIGDADGARSILEEVQQDGTPEQKETAAKLLQQIDG